MDQTSRSLPSAGTSGLRGRSRNGGSLSRLFRTANQILQRYLGIAHHALTG